LKIQRKQRKEDKTMKNTLKIDFANRTIIMDREFAKNASNTFSAEYQKLQAVRAENPDFTVVRKTIKKNPKKESYKGLTYQYMEDYITMHEPKESRKAVLDEFYEKRLILSAILKLSVIPLSNSGSLKDIPKLWNSGLKQKRSL